MQAENGTPVTPAVREHLTQAHLHALQAAHPHEYRVRMISDELEIAVTGKIEADNYARSLEEQVTERNHLIQELTDHTRRLQAARAASEEAVQTDYDTLVRETAELAGQLQGARERAARAEQRCQQLEHLLDQLDVQAPVEDEVRDRRPAPGRPRRQELQAALEQAVTHHSLTLVYQPIVRLADGELYGFEGLARWPHSEWGAIRPSQFINLAEETGQIVPLGAWVLGQAATDMLHWRQDLSGRAPHYVSVNVSARQFSETGFVDSVRQVLDTSGLPPSALMLELTESAPIPLAQQISRNLTALKATGVILAIDDYGTSPSSLSTLRELPVDVLKIDGGLFGETQDRDHPDHLQAVIETAGSLRIKVIAEGIETTEQRDLLITLGCQYGQGHLLAMPLEADQARDTAKSDSY